MLSQPRIRPSSSSTPTVLIVLALVAGAGYLLFFRPKPPPPPASSPPPVAAAPVPLKAAPTAPARIEPAVEAPKPEPARKLQAKVDAPAPVAVAFTPPAKSARTEVDELIADGKWREARLKLAATFSGAVPDAERAELSQAGIKISAELLQNKPDDRDVELYEIQQGDTLEGIAKKFKGQSGVKGALMLVNNYKENALLRAGRKVRIPKGTWSVLVDKSIFKMWILYEGCPVRAYTITTGAPSKETPVTKFVVGGKNPKPAWWPPADVKVSGKVPVPYGDPQNPLGEWWISLEHDLHHGIGIHGTNDPGSIGSKASNGCIRMLNEEVVEIAALAYKGMVVTVAD